MRIICVRIFFLIHSAPFPKIVIGPDLCYQSEMCKPKAEELGVVMRMLTRSQIARKTEGGEEDVLTDEALKTPMLLECLQDEDGRKAFIEAVNSEETLKGCQAKAELSVAEKGGKDGDVQFFKKTSVALSVIL